MNFVKVNYDASLKDAYWIRLGNAARNAAGKVLFVATRQNRGG